MSQQLIVHLSLVDDNNATTELIIVDIKDVLTPEGQIQYIEHLKQEITNYHNLLKTLGSGIY